MTSLVTNTRKCWSVIDQSEYAVQATGIIIENEDFTSEPITITNGVLQEDTLPEKVDRYSKNAILYEKSNYAYMLASE